MHRCRRFAVFLHKSLAAPKVVDPLGRETAFCYNSLNVLESTTDADGIVTKYTYNKAGLVSKVERVLSGETLSSALLADDGTAYFNDMQGTSLAAVRDGRSTGGPTADLKEHRVRRMPLVLCMSCLTACIATTSLAKELNFPEVEESSAQYGEVGFPSCHIENDTLVHCPREYAGGIIVPHGIKHIGKSAFSECRGVTSVFLPTGIETIGESAFESCEKLESVDIPMSVTSICARAFLGCRRLKYARMAGGIVSIGDSAFQECSSLSVVFMPSSARVVGSRVFSQCSKLENAEIGVGVRCIGDEVFLGCASLTQVSLPWNLRQAGSHVFSGCSRLRTVMFKDPLSMQTRICSLGIGHMDGKEPSLFQESGVWYVKQCNGK